MGVRPVLVVGQDRRGKFSRSSSVASSRRQKSYYMRRFSYRWTRIAAIDWSVVVIAIGTIFSIIVIKQSESHVGYGILLALHAFIFPLYVYARLFLSEIEVDDNGVYCRIFGRVWRRMRWSEVKRIRISKNYNVAVRRELTIVTILAPRRKKYYFYETERLLLTTL